jgi:hypothetical protein
MTIEQAIIEKLRSLPLDKQQEALNFVEALQIDMKASSSTSSRWEGMSALESASEYAGCLEGGPPDLSTNPKYMEGFGES